MSKLVFFGLPKLTLCCAQIEASGKSKRVSNLWCETLPSKNGTPNHTAFLYIKCVYYFTKLPADLASRR
ncbi:hypothetical protein Hanom_Chr12g01115011 [Helianthus anomalus]